MAGYCEAQVRKFDYDRYLAGLFAPGRVRADLYALYAFNLELSRIAEVARNPVAGQIRLQWWRDRIDEIFHQAGGRTDVLTALSGAVSRHGLPQALFVSMIDARENDLESAPFADLAAMESYADATSGTLMRLSARVLGAGATLDEAARYAGRSHAITGMLRALPFYAAHSRLMLPRDETATFGVSEADLRAGRMSAALALLIGRIAEVVRGYHERLGQIDRRYLPAILPSSLTPAWLRLLNRAGFNPFRDAVEIPAYRRQWIMLRAMALRHV